MKRLALLAVFACAAFAQTAQYPGAIATDNNLKVGVNNAQTTLSSAMLSSDNVLVVANSTGFVANMLVTVGTEIIAVCAVNGNVLSVGQASCPNVDGRGFDGTVAAGHAVSSNVSGFIDAWHHNALKQEIKAIETALGVSLANVSSWGKLTAPTQNLSLSLGAFTSVWTAGNATGSGIDIFKLLDTASNTGTGNLFRVSTAVGSALHPAQFDSNGNGVQMSTAGVFQAIGSGGIDAGTLVSGSISASRIANGTITNAMLAGTIAASKLIGSDIATVGTITVGTWNGTAVTPTYGGTGQSTYTKGDLLCASNATTLTKLGVQADGSILTADSSQTCGVKWSSAGSGTVSSVSGTSPITVTNPTTTPVVACATCTTSAAALTLNQPVFGGGGQAMATLGSLGTSTTVLHGGSPNTYGFVNLPTDVTGVLPFANGFPSGSQTQFLRIQPNTGNNTTLQWASPNRAVLTDYAWTQTPGGTLTASTPATVTLTPCPQGVVQNGQGLYISGGSGTAEAVSRTGGSGSGGASSCTVQFTPTNNHSGAWTIASASGGTQEAFNASNDVWAPAGTYLIYSTVTVPSNGHLFGTGMFTSTFQAQGAAIGIFDATGTRNTFQDIGLTATVQQTAGGYGIRLGNGGGGENSFTRIDRIYCEPIYDCILGVNADQTQVTNSVFYNFSHTAITAASTNNPDDDGPWVRGNVFFNYNLASAALACVYSTSTGGITITENNCYGGGLSPAQLQYNFYVNQTASTQVVIANNVLETASVQNINVTGVFNLVTITGNTIAQPATAQNLWRGIEISGNNTTSFCGSGIGICQGTVVGNVIQGPGATSTSSVCEEVTGYSFNFLVSENTCNASQIGINIGSNVTSSTIGAHSMTNIYSQQMSGGSSTIIWNRTANTSFATLPTAGNGSELYVTNANSGCTAGASNGRTCFYENSAWTH